MMPQATSEALSSFVLVDKEDLNGLERHSEASRRARRVIACDSCGHPQRGCSRGGLGRARDDPPHMPDVSY